MCTPWHRAAEVLREFRLMNGCQCHRWGGSKAFAATKSSSGSPGFMVHGYPHGWEWRAMRQSAAPFCLLPRAAHQWRILSAPGEVRGRGGGVEDGEET